MGMKNANDSLQSGAESIFGNIMAGKEFKIGSIKSQLAEINKLFNDPNSYPTLNDKIKKEELEKELNRITNSIIS